MNREPHNSNNYQSWLKLLTVPVGIVITLFLFQSILLAYVVGILTLIRASERNMVMEVMRWLNLFPDTGIFSQKNMSEPNKIAARTVQTVFTWVLVYSIAFLLLVIPIAATLQENRNIKLLPRDTARYFQSIVD